MGGIMLAANLRLDVLGLTRAGCRNDRHLPSRIASRRTSPITGPIPWPAPRRALALAPSGATSPRRLNGCFANFRCAQSRLFVGPPLLRFLPLQREPTAMRCPGRPASGRSRCGVYPPACDPRVRGPFANRRRPCGFSLCKRDAVWLDVRTNRRLRLAPLCAASPRRLSECLQERQPSLIGRAGRSGNPIDFAHERSVTSSATASFHSPPWAVMHRRVLCAVFRYRQLEPSRPGRTSGPSLCSPGGAHGIFLVLRRFAPVTGGSSISGPAGPTCLFSLRIIHPINFRRAEFRRWAERE